MLLRGAWHGVCFVCAARLAVCRVPLPRPKCEPDAKWNDRFLQCVLGLWAPLLLA